MTQPIVDVGTVHRHVFLQTLMKRSFVPAKEAEDLLQSLYGGKQGLGVEHVISEINLELSAFGFEVRKIKAFDGKVYVGFVNREADEMSKKSTGYRTKDGKPDVKMAAYFKSLVEKIARCEDPVDGIGYITSQDAYYAPIYVPDEENQGEGSQQQQLKEVQGFSITDREKSLDAFKRDGWLSEHPKEEGLLTLGPRAILELGPWILNAHGSEMAAESKLTLSRAIGR